MIKIIFGILSFYFLIGNSFGQTDTYHKFYIELLGNAGLYSLNYEYPVTQKLNFRLGQTFLPSFSGKDVGDDTGTLITLGANYLIALSDRSYIELGFNGTKAVADNNKFYTGTIAYRFEPVDTGIFYKFSFVPVIYKKNRFIPWLGLSIGLKADFSNAL